MNMPSAAKLSLVVFAVAACCRSGSTQPDSGAVGAQAAAAPEKQRQTRTVPAQMERHARSANRAFAAAVSGDLGRMREAMLVLANDEWSPYLKTAWKEHHDRLREAAGQVAKARARDEALESFALVGQSCSDCHQSAGGPAATASEAPPAGSDEMVHHQWAAEQLWLGLMAPSDEAWLRGAGAMATARLVRSDERQVDRIAGRVVELSKRATTVPSNERAGIMSRFLAACGDCHDLLQVEIPRD